MKVLYFPSTWNKCLSRTWRIGDSFGGDHSILLVLILTQSDKDFIKSHKNRGVSRIAPFFYLQIV
jgi:hypothetical protein